MKSVKKDCRLINLNCLSTQLLSDTSKWKFSENPQYLQLTSKIIRTRDFTFPLSLMHFVFPIKFRISFVSFPQATLLVPKKIENITCAKSMDKTNRRFHGFFF